MKCRFCSVAVGVAGANAWDEPACIVDVVTGVAMGLTVAGVVWNDEWCI